MKNGNLVFLSFLLILLAGCSFSKDQGGAKTPEAGQPIGQQEAGKKDIFQSISEGNLDQFQQILAQTPDSEINAYDKAGRTALEVAVRYENVKIAELLLERGALPLKPHYQTEETPLGLAERMSPSIFQVLNRHLVSQKKKILSLIQDGQHLSAFQETKRQFLTQDQSLSKSFFQGVSNQNFIELYQQIFEDGKMIRAALDESATTIARLDHDQITTEYFRWSKEGGTQVPNSFYQNLLSAKRFEFVLKQAVQNQIQVSSEQLLFNFDRYVQSMNAEEIMKSLSDSKKVGLDLQTNDEKTQAVIKKLTQNFLSKVTIQANGSRELTWFFSFFEASNFQLNDSHQFLQQHISQNLYRAELESSTFQLAEIEALLRLAQKVYLKNEFCENCIDQVLSAKSHVTQRQGLLKVLFATSGAPDAEFVARFLMKTNIDDLKLVLQSMTRSQLSTQSGALLSAVQKGANNKESNELANLLVQSGLNIQKQEASEAIHLVLQKRQKGEQVGREFLYSLLAMMKDMEIRISKESAQKYLLTEYLNILNSGVEDEGVLGKIAALSDQKVTYFEVQSKKLNLKVQINPLYLLKKKMIESKDSTWTSNGTRFGRTTVSIFGEESFFLRIEDSSGKITSFDWIGALAFSKNNEASGEWFLIRGLDAFMILSEGAALPFGVAQIPKSILEVMEIVAKDQQFLESPELPILFKKYLMRSNLRLFMAMSDRSLAPLYQQYLNNPGIETDFLCEKSQDGALRVRTNFIESKIAGLESNAKLSEADRNRILLACQSKIVIQEKIRDWRKPDPAPGFVFALQFGKEDPAFASCYIQQPDAYDRIKTGCSCSWFNLASMPDLLSESQQSLDGNWMRAFKILKDVLEDEVNSEFKNWLGSSCYS